MQELVTVVIPTRNRPELLARAIRSVLAQTHRELEVLVVIDGPDPATEAVVTAVGDPRVRALCLPDSVGGAEARNIGARAAQGRWVALLDDDDEFLPQKVEVQLQQALATGANLVTSRFITRAPRTPDVLRPRRMPSPGEDMGEFIFDYLCYFQSSTFFCSRDLLLAFPYSPNLKFFQDNEWFLRVNRDRNTKLSVVEQPLTIYYAPVDRSTITASHGRKSRLQWGLENRSLLTRRAWARFIVGSCSGRGPGEPFVLSEFLQLLKECALHGSPTPKLLMLLCGSYALPVATRRRWRDRLFLQSSVQS